MDHEMQGDHGPQSCIQKVPGSRLTVVIVLLLVVFTLCFHSPHWVGQLLHPGGQAVNYPGTTHAVEGEVEPRVVCTGEQRAAWLNRICDTTTPLRMLQNSTDRRYPGSWYLVLDRKHRVLYGIVPKAGSSSILGLIVSHYTNKSMADIIQNGVPGVHGHPDRYGIPLLTGSKLDAKTKRMILKSYFTFTMVRHPLRRLYSAYRDKFLTTSEYPKYAKISHDFIANLHYVNNTPVYSFQQFMELVVDHEYMDWHWRPMSEFLIPCGNKYDYVGKVETLEEDAAHILPHLKKKRWLHLQSRHEIKLRVKGNLEVDGEGRTDTDSLLNAELLRMPETRLTKLLQLYTNDFLLFGYNWNKYSGLQCQLGNLGCC